ncbi:MAG: hypothetical protein WCI29_04990 [Actinomycetes bacterium]
METLRWLLIPLGAVALGLIWVAWRSRRRQPVAPEQGMEDRERMRQAMERPLPSHRVRAEQYHEDDLGPRS